MTTIVGGLVTLQASPSAEIRMNVSVYINRSDLLHGRKLAYIRHSSANSHKYSDCLFSFRRQLKTLLFRAAFAVYSPRLRMALLHGMLSSFKLNWIWGSKNPRWRNLNFIYYLVREYIAWAISDRVAYILQARSYNYGPTYVYVFMCTMPHAPTGYKHGEFDS